MYLSFALNVPRALSQANMKSSTLCDSNECPFPYSESHLNSNTESFNPPVLKATTGVPPTKNSCWTIPPGSNILGMRP